MANDFTSLRKDRAFDSLSKAIDKFATPQEGNSSNKDERFWQPEVDKAGNGSAVIRFLPSPKGED